jgi:hypothetical protein
MEPSEPTPETNPGAHPGSEPSPAPPLRPDNRYEERDVSFRAVVIVAVAGCAIGGVTFFAVRGFYWAALESRTGGQTALAPADRPSEKPTEQLPPEPRLELLDRLQKTPASNVARWEQGEEKSLEKYARSDEKGFVRIPLEQAMDLTAGQLKARPASEVPKFRDKGLVDAGESNSGRMFRGAKP